MQGDDDDETSEHPPLAGAIPLRAARQLDVATTVERSPDATDPLATTINATPLPDDVTSTAIDALPAGATQIDPLASIDPATEVEALPHGARQIDPLASIDPATAAAARRVRDEALSSVFTATDIDPLPAGARQIDPLATIDPATAAAAQQAREAALAKVRGDIDINATIVTKRASTAAEHARDFAFEKLRAGEEEDLKSTIARPRPGSGTHQVDTADSSRHTPRATSSADDHIAGLDAQDLALVERLRGLPGEGHEPDWRRLEASIREEIGDRPTYMPWWQSWRYLVPIGALATTAVITMIVIKVARREPDRTSLLAPRDAGVTETRPVDDSARERSSTLWLDGEPFDLDELDPAALDEIAPVLEEVAVDATTDDAAARVELGAGEGDEAEPLDDGTSDGILPLTDYGWIDSLDDGEVERAESWLARKRS